MDAVDKAKSAPVAQRTEQRFPKPRVGRSSRPRGTRKISRLAEGFVGALNIGKRSAFRGLLNAGSCMIDWVVSSKTVGYRGLKKD